jgi:nitrous oxide reductase family maturation protein NosD
MRDHASCKWRADRASRGGKVLALYAALALLAALLMPWWHMENRAPQYGKRVLVIDVSPFGVSGDTSEIDALGHYVGIRPVASFAPFERSAAPWAVGVTLLAALALPFLPCRKMRWVAAGAVVAVPALFVVDLWAWQRYAVTHLDPHAALNLIANRVDARVVGSYDVAQFKVSAEFAGGFWLAVVAAANAAAFLLVERRRDGPPPQRQANPPRPLDHRLPVLTGAAVVLAIAALPADAGTIEAGPGTDHATIASAVAAAAPGDEVFVRAGIYRENVVVDRPIVLRGEKGTVVDGGGRGTIVLVTKGPTTVRDLTVRNSGDSLLAEDAGVKLLGCEDCAVVGLAVEDTLFGVMARTAPRSRIEGNRIVGLDLPLPRRADGIRVQDAKGSIVERNVLDRTRDLAIWQSDGCVVRGNTVRGARYGLHYMYCDDNLFEDNVFEGCHTGGAIMYSRRVTLRGNRFTGSRGPSAYGLLLKTADDVVVERNWFLDNTCGILFDGAPSSLHSTCTVRENVVAGNGSGLALEPSTSGALFTGNVFAANRVQVEVLGARRADRNRWSENGRGNFWSDYAGFDADGDGIGDTPFVLEQFFEDLSGRFPEIGLLRGGPAAEALDVAARAFPILDPKPTLRDEHPLIAPPAALAAARTSPSQWPLAAAGAGGAAVAGFVVLRSRRTPQIRGLL